MNYFQTTTAAHSAASAQGSSAVTAAKERPDELNIKQLAQVRKELLHLCKFMKEYCTESHKLKTISEQTSARADALARGHPDAEAGAGAGLGVPAPPRDHGRLCPLPLQDAGGVARTGKLNT